MLNSSLNCQCGFLTGNIEYSLLTCQWLFIAVDVRKWLIIDMSMKLCQWKSIECSMNIYLTVNDHWEIGICVNNFSLTNQWSTIELSMINHWTFKWYILRYGFLMSVNDFLLNIQWLVIELSIILHWLVNALSLNCQ